MTKPNPDSVPKDIVDPFADVNDPPEIQSVVDPPVTSEDDDAPTPRELELMAQLAELENAQSREIPDVDDTVEEPETHKTQPLVPPATRPARPRPDSELTPAELRERQLEHSLALRAGQLDPEEKFGTERVDGDVILLHVLKDGLTFADRTWFRGQEVEYVVGSAAYQDTLDRNGDSWLDHLSQAEQYKRFGDLVFGFGPWPGAPYDDETALTAEQKRARRVPLIST